MLHASREGLDKSRLVLLVSYQSFNLRINPVMII
jgi:hypothetical protein